MKSVDPDTVPLTYVEVTEQRRLNEAREKSIPWKKWGPISVSGSGVLCAKITATTAMRGTTFRTTSRVPAPTTGAKMDWLESQMTSSSSASRSRYGTGLPDILYQFES